MSIQAVIDDDPTKKKQLDSTQQSQEIINSADSTLLQSKSALSKMDSLLVKMEKLKNR